MTPAKPIDIEAREAREAAIVGVVEDDSRSAWQSRTNSKGRLSRYSSVWLQFLQTYPVYERAPAPERVEEE
jgi:hypothetical protein